MEVVNEQVHRFSIRRGGSNDVASTSARSGRGSKHAGHGDAKGQRGKARYSESRRDVLLLLEKRRQRQETRTAQLGSVERSKASTVAVYCLSKRLSHRCWGRLRKRVIGGRVDTVVQSQVAVELFPIHGTK
jgi:hypothetical protein